MALFPKIQSPCPVMDSMSDYIEGDVCRLCDRTVHDIGSMSDHERQSFLASCSTEVCVTYSLGRKSHVAAVALSSVLAALPSAAQDTSPIELETTCPVEASLECGELVLDEEEFVWVIGGGIKDPARVEYVDTEEDLAIPTVPVTYENSD